VAVDVGVVMVFLLLKPSQRIEFLFIILFVSMSNALLNIIGVPLPLQDQLLALFLDTLLL